MTDKEANKLLKELQKKSDAELKEILDRNMPKGKLVVKGKIIGIID